jgi:hypothetical protein
VLQQNNVLPDNLPDDAESRPSKSDKAISAAVLGVNSFSEAIDPND